MELSVSTAILIPAAVALLVSVVTLLANFMISDRRARYEAGFEAAKYREKWLANLRSEISEYTSTAFTLAIKDKKSVIAVNDLTQRRFRIILAVPISNPHYDDLYEALNNVFDSAIQEESRDHIGKNTKILVDVSKKILKAEWTDIQILLANGIKKKRLKNNA